MNAKKNVTTIKALGQTIQITKGKGRLGEIKVIVTERPAFTDFCVSVELGPKWGNGYGKTANIALAKALRELRARASYPIADALGTIRRLEKRTERERKHLAAAQATLDRVLTSLEAA
jgi:hypothetical protein